MSPQKSLFRIYALYGEHVQDANSLDEAKVIAKWNFLKGYEIVDIMGMIVERWEHFCPTCRKCETCGHLASEHIEGKYCNIKKCKCKELIVDVEKYAHRDKATKVQ